MSGYEEMEKKTEIKRPADPGDNTTTESQEGDEGAEGAEVWRPVKGFEGVYEVSSAGRVRSVNRIRYLKSRRGKIVARQLRGNIMRVRDNGHGYKVLILRNRKTGERKSCYVHRLVAEAFIRNPQELPVINHLDYDRGNNSVKNLEWTTHRANVHYSLGHMRKPRNGSNNRSTGEKYIFRANGKYRLQIRNTCFVYDRRFRTLGEAVKMREVVLRDQKYFAG